MNTVKSRFTTDEAGFFSYKEQEEKNKNIR